MNKIRQHTNAEGMIPDDINMGSQTNTDNTGDDDYTDTSIGTDQPTGDVTFARPKNEG